MHYKNFYELIQTIKKSKTVKQAGVVAADDRHTLEAVVQAYKEGIVEPILIGKKKIIIEILNDLQFDYANISIIDSKSPEDAVEVGVALAKDGEVDFLIKGLVETAVLMKAVVNKENQLRTGDLISSIAFLEIPTYHKLLAVTDGGVSMYPDLEQKKKIIENAVECLSKMGILDPKVAVLTAVEVLNPKMSETVDAAELKKMNFVGELKGCIVEGPISYDLAISKEAAKIKKFDSIVAGDADLLVYPDITAGNLVTKALTFSGQAKGAAIIVGAKVPIVFLSRSSSAEEKYLSIVLAASGNWR